MPATQRFHFFVMPRIRKFGTKKRSYRKKATIKVVEDKRGQIPWLFQQQIIKQLNLFRPGLRAENVIFPTREVGCKKLYPKKRMKVRKTTRYQRAMKLLYRNIETMSYVVSSVTDQQYTDFNAGAAWSWKLDFDKSITAITGREAEQVRYYQSGVDMQIWHKPSTGDEKVAYTYRFLVLQLLEPNTVITTILPTDILDDCAGTEEALKAGYIQVKNKLENPQDLRPHKIHVLSDNKFTLNVSDEGTGNVKQDVRIFIPAHTVRYHSEDTGAGTKGVGMCMLVMITDAPHTNANYEIQGYRYEQKWDQLRVAQTN